MNKRMILNETSYFGPGSIKVFSGELNKHGFSRVLVITDAETVKAKTSLKITKILAENKIVYQVFDKVKANPTIQNIRSCVETAEYLRADCIVAVGGTAVIDTAKAVSIICTNPEFKDARKLEGLSKTSNRGLPLIALPAAGGTASEVTINYVITDEDRQHKFVCIDPLALPFIAIVDTDLSAKVPAETCALAGAAALSNAIEGYLTKDAWQLTDMYCLEAIKIISENLKAAVKGNEKAREQIAYAQYISGMGFSNSGLGLVNAMAHPLGAVYDVPDELACAVLLPQVLAFNAPSTGTKMRDIAVAMGVKVSAKATPAAYRKSCLTAVEKLFKEAGVAKKLTAAIEKKDLEFLAESALKDVYLEGNPKEASKKKIMDIYKSVI